MYLVVSYAYNTFYGTDTTCQFEISNNLTRLHQKYGPTTERHIDMDVDTSVVFDLHYFNILDDVFNLKTAHLTQESISKILESEPKDTSYLDLDDIKLLKNDNYDVDDADDEQSEDGISVCDSDEKISGIQKIVIQINDYRKKIYELLSKKNKTPKPDKLEVNINLNLKENQRHYRKLHRVKYRLANRYQNILNGEPYYYLLVYFDKNVMSSFEHIDTNYETIKIHGDELLYFYKPKLKWTTLDYELFYHSNAHFKLFDNIDDMIQHVDDIIGKNKELYDNINIFFNKLTLHKDYNIVLDQNHEIWLASDKHPTIISPSRLTHNRFFNEIVELKTSIQTHNVLTETYQTINPCQSTYHHITLERTVPYINLNVLDELITNVEQEEQEDNIDIINDSNIMIKDNTNNNTIGQLIKEALEYKIIHNRMH